MLTYIISFSLAVFFASFTRSKKEELKSKRMKNIIFAILSALPLFAIAAFRYGVGNDYFNYANYFQDSLYINYMEVGFDWIVTTIRQYTDNSVWMFAVFTFIFIYFMYRAIYDQSINPALSIFIFICSPYYFEFYSGMRQMITVAMFLYSIKFIKERKIIPYIITILAASCIHSSCILMLPVYFLYNLKLTPKKCLVLFGVTILSRPILGALLAKIISLTKYVSYFDSEFNTGHFGIVTLIVPLFIFLFAAINYKKDADDKDVKEYQLYCNMMFIQVLIVLVQDLSPLITRLGWGFGITQIILIPLVIDRVKGGRNKFYITAIICILFVTYLCIMRFSGGGTLLPFRWIFNH